MNRRVAVSRSAVAVLAAVVLASCGGGDQGPEDAGGTTAPAAAGAGEDPAASTAPVASGSVTPTATTETATATATQERETATARPVGPSVAASRPRGFGLHVEGLLADRHWNEQVDSSFSLYALETAGDASAVVTREWLPELEQEVEQRRDTLVLSRGPGGEFLAVAVTEATYPSQGLDGRRTLLHLSGYDVRSGEQLFLEDLPEQAVEAELLAATDGVVTVELAPQWSSGLERWWAGYDMATGELLWEKQGGAPVSVLGFPGLFVAGDADGGGTDDVTYALDARTGEEVWRLSEEQGATRGLIHLNGRDLMVEVDGVSGGSTLDLRPRIFSIERILRAEDGATVYEANERRGEGVTMLDPVTGQLVASGSFSGGNFDCFRTFDRTGEMLLEAGCDGAIELFGTYNGLSWVETADEVLVVDNTTGESVGRDWTSHPVAGGEGYVVIGVPDSEAHSIYTGVRPDSDLLSITGATAEQ